MTKHYLSKEGYESLKQKLDNMKTIERKKIAKSLSEAREQGDLSENAEYDAAKEAQAELEVEISRTEEMLKNAEIIEETKKDEGIGFGSVVELKNITCNEKLKVTIVGGYESDSLNGLISNESPLGQAMWGKEKNEEITIKVGDFVTEYKILKILK